MIPKNKPALLKGLLWSFFAATATISAFILPVYIAFTPAGSFGLKGSKIKYNSHMQYRTEKDAIGSIKVPKDAYYGSFTTRAIQNFDISGITAPMEFKKALGHIKKAAAATNMQLNEIEKDHGKAIIQAAEEFINGKFDREFILDVFQAGAGTPFNMNINEIIANRANEILGSKKGIYDPVTPNNHVNCGQSSNDVIPTAIRIAGLIKSRKLIIALKDLISTIEKKSGQFKNILKVGRTHLQDAVPITLGQEFEAYSEAMKKNLVYLEEALDKLRVIGLGGTAVGTGITAHPQYKKTVLEFLNRELKLDLIPAASLMEMTNNMGSFGMVSAALRQIANSLSILAGDLRILTSGPSAIGEIILKEVEPGSSIMPGKVNPSVTECVTMAAYQVIGCDTVINQCIQASQLQLNTMTPLILHNLLWEMELLSNAVKVLNQDCVSGIKANKERCKLLLDKSLCLATALSPYIGYKITAEVVKETYKKKQNVKKTILDNKLIEKKDLDALLSIEKMTNPCATNIRLKKKITENQNYKKYVKKLK